MKLPWNWPFSNGRAKPARSPRAAAKARIIKARLVVEVLEDRIALSTSPLALDPVHAAWRAQRFTLNDQITNAAQTSVTTGAIDKLFSTSGVNASFING